MIRRFATLLMLALAHQTATAATLYSCSPMTYSCEYTGCMASTSAGTNPVWVSEVACATCSASVRTEYQRVYGGTLSGTGYCASTTAANFCTGCEWCTAVLVGCGGGGGQPPACDPAGYDHPDLPDARTEFAIVQPRRWMVEFGGQTIVVLAYEGRSAVPREAAWPYAGLYLVASPDRSMGHLGERHEMLRVTGRLLLTLAGAVNPEGAVRYFNGDPADVTVERSPGANQCSPAIRVNGPRGEWGLSWCALIPLKGGYFPYSPYPRLDFGGRAASPQELEAALVNAGIKFQ